MTHVTVVNCFHKSGYKTLSALNETDLINEEPVLTEVINGDN